MNPSSDTGWLFLVTQRYQAILEVALESLAQHSIYPATPIKLTEPFRWSQKPEGMLRTPYKYTCYIDADTILGPDCDRVFEYVRHCGRFPIFHPHPHRTLLFADQVNARVDALKSETRDAKPFPFFAANLLLYSRAAFPFIRRWLALCEMNPNADSDEESMNRALREQSPFAVMPPMATHHFDCGCYPMVHGCKRPRIAKALLKAFWPPGKRKASEVRAELRAHRLDWTQSTH